MNKITWDCQKLEKNTTNLKTKNTLILRLVKNLNLKKFENQIPFIFFIKYIENCFNGFSLFFSNNSV